LPRSARQKKAAHEARPKKFIWEETPRKGHDAEASKPIYVAAHNFASETVTLKHGVSESYIHRRGAGVPRARKKPDASAGLKKFGDGGVLEKEDVSCIGRFG
jgi:hypothetical protein